MKRFISLALSVVLSFTAVISLVSCDKKPQKFSRTAFDYFDTVATITGLEETREQFDKNCDRIENKLEEYHRLFTIYSRYNGLNNLRIVNETENGVHNRVKVDPKIINLLEFSKEMYALTKGKTNVAMGSVLSIWHDYRSDGMEDPVNAKLPQMENLLEADKHTDIENLIIDKENNTVFLSNPKTTLDVGAVAKGFATEEIAVWMEQEGMTGYLLNIGGNIRAVGKRPDGKKWQIGIENPDLEDEETPYTEYLEIEDISLVVSGSYQRFYTVNGKNYHHIIDPETLMPSENFASVSVLCKSSALADALSTALFTMDLKVGKMLVESLDGVEALWIENSGRKFYSENFKNYIREENK